MNMKGWLIMKYVIEIHTDCIESWKNAIGAPGYHGECIQKINVFSLVALVRCGHIGIRRNFSERIVYKNGIGKLID